MLIARGELPSEDDVQKCPRFRYAQRTWGVPLGSSRSLYSMHSVNFVYFSYIRKNPCTMSALRYPRRRSTSSLPVVSAGVGAGVHFFDVLGRHLGIYLRRRHRSVPKQLLNNAYVCTPL